jgi:hypothetical protein
MSAVRACAHTRVRPGVAAGAARREGVHGGGAARARHRPAPVREPVRPERMHACMRVHMYM